MSHSSLELLVVMPAYNEAATVASVVREWFVELDHQTCDFKFLAIDDGSTDSTHQVLEELKHELGDRLEVLSHTNRGHGQSCMAGYRIAIERRIPFVFQIDSDGQSDPRYFGNFWASRDLHDVIYGRRIRSDGRRRVLASLILRVLLKVVTKADCVDANVPYRLMSTKTCASAISGIPTDMFLANVALAVVLRKNPEIHHGAIQIGFPPRRGGEPSVPLRKFAGRALELLGQMKRAGIC